MQFHLNGFQPGDPEIQPDMSRRAAGSPLPATTDVLIVGCGSAGLTLAAQMSAFADIETVIIERKPGPMQRGQADGVSCRSMEMFAAFGFAHRVCNEAYWVNETTFWKPDPSSPQNIIRTGRIQDVEDGLSEMPHVILNQARVHDMYLEFMERSATRLVPDYSRQLAGLEL
ncbi:MAG: FAD-dependent monooxygenase, partial [Pseudomonadota bacterium]|nr:FAD-dependent monooxygenase [Pseudomonadota bacterium]